MNIMTRCLNITNFLADAVELLISEGLCEEEEEDGHASIKIYGDLDLMDATNKLVQQLVDSPVLQIDDSSFDWPEGFTNRAGTDDAKIDWFHGITMEMVTQTRDLSVYVDIIRCLEPRSTEDVRIDKASLFYAVVGEGDGGQLMSALRAYYHPNGHPASTTYLSRPGVHQGRHPSPRRSASPIFASCAAGGGAAPGPPAARPRRPAASAPAPARCPNVTAGAGTIDGGAGDGGRGELRNRTFPRRVCQASVPEGHGASSRRAASHCASSPRPRPARRHAGG